MCDFGSGSEDDWVSSPEPNLPDELLNMGILDSDTEVNWLLEDPIEENCNSSCDLGLVPASEVNNDEEIEEEAALMNEENMRFESSESNSDLDPDYIPIAENDAEAMEVGELTVEVEGGTEDEEPYAGSSTKRTTKKNRDQKTWACNKRKKARESGQEYTDLKAEHHSARFSHSSCLKGCTFGCSKAIIKQEQLGLFAQFWRLNDDKKLHFYSKFVVQKEAARKRTENEFSKKLKSFEYFFELNGDRIRVCRAFFLSTLDISQTHIYHFFRHNINRKEGVAKSPKKGKHAKYFIHPAVLDGVRKHIASFPVVDSHYTRANSLKKYLDQMLSLPKMYTLYLESNFIVANLDPAKQSMYRKIFNTEFNFSFYKPRKDRCDTCEAFKMLKEPSEDQSLSQENHLRQKFLCKQERDYDHAAHKRENHEDATEAVISFDLENVLALPRAEVSNFFYHRKLNCYNLTAHCSVSGRTYCALWNEALSGRASNHIASALVKILYEVCSDHPNLKKIILWSDSCIPQNKNRMMSSAIASFLMDPNVTVQYIKQKYSEAGHGLVQEVDTIHSKIERCLSKTEIFSPVSLLRIMKTFREVFDEEFTKIRLNRVNTPRSKKAPKPASSPLYTLFPKVGIISTPAIIAPAKISDLEAMYCYMPQVDVDYYKVLLKRP